MKNTFTALACAASLTAVNAQAGDLTSPVVEPEIVAADTAAGSSSEAEIIVLMTFLVIAGAAIASGGGSLPAPSDARLKTGITRVGLSDSGLPVYRFGYKGLAGTYRGVMAQDLLSLRPDAVIDMGAFLAVDYGAIDVDFVRID